MSDPRGGAREGAGRPPGGQLPRPVRKMLGDIVWNEFGPEVVLYDPLLVLIAMASDEKTPLKLKADCANWAAKFLHPTLAAVHIMNETRNLDPSAALGRLTSAMEATKTIELSPSEIEPLIESGGDDAGKVFLAELLNQSEGE